MTLGGAVRRQRPVRHDRSGIIEEPEAEDSEVEAVEVEAAAGEEEQSAS